MNRVKYISIRLMILALILIIAEVFHRTFIYPKIKKDEGWLQTLVENKTKNKADVYYFSASPNQASANDESDKRFISAIANESSKLKISSVDTGAIHAGIFYKILNHLPKNKYPKAIVMDLNIRSFGVNWIHSNLENALQRNFVYWNQRPSIVNHFLAATKWYDYKSPAEHLRAIEYEEKFGQLPYSKNHSTIKKWVDSLFKTKQYSEEGKLMIQQFAFEIKRNNEQLKNYDLIVKWANRHQIPLIFVILPENVQRMEQLAGKELSDLVSKNAHFLLNHYNGKNVQVLDLHKLVDKDQFFEFFPTEHYRSKGRIIVGTAIANEINKIK